MRRSLEKRINGPTRIDFLKIEQFADMANQLMFRLQRNAEDPIFQFKNTVGKIAYGISTLLGIVYSVGVLISIALVVDFVAQKVFGVYLSWQAFVQSVVSYTWFQLILVIIALIIVRRVLVRLNEPESNLGSRR